MEYRIRPITPADNAPLAAIIRASLREHGLALPGTAYFDPELDHLSTFYDASAQRAYFVAVDNEGRVVGGCGIAEFSGTAGIAELQKLYVSPEAQRHGLAHRLITAVEDFARDAGYRQLYLETHHNLQAAVHLYRDLGWQELDAPLPGSIHSTMDIFMSKQLGNTAQPSGKEA